MSEADEAWEAWRTAKYSSDRNDALRPAVEATARAIAREGDVAAAIASLVRRVDHQAEIIAKLRRKLNERVAWDVDKVLANGPTSGVGEQERESKNPWHRLVWALEDIGVETITAERLADAISDLKTDPPAPSEGEEGEEEPDLPVEAVHAIRSLRASGWHMTADRLSECVAGLQQERDEARERARMYNLDMMRVREERDEARDHRHWNIEETDEGLRVCPGYHGGDECEWKEYVPAERLGELRAEIAQLRDPANWRVEHEGRLLPYTLTRLHYVGPNPDSTEAEQDDFEQYADEKVREIARIMDDSTEADEGESVRGEVAGFEADHPNSVGWLHIATQEERVPFAIGTPVRITKLPETQEDDDGE